MLCSVVIAELKSIHQTRVSLKVIAHHFTFYSVNYIYALFISFHLYSVVSKEDQHTVKMINALHKVF